MIERKSKAGVLFADISDSSGLYNESGDEVARRIVIECLDLLCQTVEAGGGRVVDRIGDEVMCLFPSPSLTAQGSIALQRAVACARVKGAVPRNLRIRIGFQCGPVLIDGNRVFGDAVYVARRMAALAKGQQILTTGDSLLTLPKNEFDSRLIDYQHIKGKSDRTEIVEIVWDRGSATVRSRRENLQMVEARSLIVCRGDDTYVLSASRPTLNIGRDEICDVVIEHPRVSRVHARIELRKRGYFLLDVSMNGTRVTDSGGEPALVKRDEVKLGQRGTIELGSGEADDSSIHTLSYSIVE